jgi:hypothetical protein
MYKNDVFILAKMKDIDTVAKNYRNNKYNNEWTQTQMHKKFGANRQKYLERT